MKTCVWVSILRLKNEKLPDRLYMKYKATSVMFLRKMFIQIMVS
jgi:hypothetical protein